MYIFEYRMLRARVLAAANIGRVYAAAVIVLAIVETAESLEPTECTRDHIKEAISGISACKPREVVIQLPWPNNTDIQQMTPSHVLIQHCTGGCTPLEPSCLPSKTRTKRVSVLVAKCGINLGICDKECATVELEEHLECKCACALTPRDCSEAQQFAQSECACKCTNLSERQQCLESGKVWNSSSCSCNCSPDHCSSEQQFDFSSCTCIQNDFEPRTILNMTNQELMSLEVMIIIFLISTVTVLFLLFICLVLKLRRIKVDHQRKKLVPSTLSGAYMSSSDPCSDLQEHNTLRSRGVLQRIEPPHQPGPCELRDPCTDSSHCSHSSSSSSNHSMETVPVSTRGYPSMETVTVNTRHYPSMETVPVSANLAIRSGTLTRSGGQSYNSYKLVPNSDTRQDFI